MKIRYKHIYILLLLIVFLVSSCRTTDEISIPEQEIKKSELLIFEKIIEQQPQFSTATTKCNVAIDKLSSKAQIKMINGEYIQISLTPLLGIEVFRITMTQDSIYVIDKINSQVAEEPLASVKKYLPQGVGIKELQKIILGVPFLVADTLTNNKYKKFEWNRTPETVQMQSVLDKSASIMFSNNLEGVLQSTTIEYNAKPIVEFQYTSHKPDAQAKLRPSQIKVWSNIPQLGMSISATISGMSVEWNKRVVKDTKISSRYKRVSLSQLLGNYF